MHTPVLCICIENENQANKTPPQLFAAVEKAKETEPLHK